MQRGANDQILGGVADIQRSHGNAVVSQYDIQPMVEIFATTQGRDLGAVSADIREHHRPQCERPSRRARRSRFVGQVQTMNSAFSGLLFGLLGAIVLIYLLIVINFQSWTDPLVIVTALPAALAGIVWMLFATDTTLSVPALTGAIMCMGVATANSMLVISFAANSWRSTATPPRPRWRPVRAPAAGPDDGSVDDHRHGCRWRSALAKAANRTRRSAAR